jgi:O-antigen/teichoic acid export membrane protein
LSEGNGFITGILNQLLRKSEFIKNTSKLAGATVIAQFIPFLAIPLLARIYTPAEFGWFGVYYALANIISVVATGRYELAILLPDNRRKVNHITRLAESLTLATGLLVFLVTLFFHPSVSRVLSVEPVAAILMLLPLSITCMALLQVYAYRHNREKNYTIISSGKIIYSIVLAASQIGLGYLGFTTAGLIFGSVIAVGVHALTLRLWRREVFREPEPLSLPLMKELASTYSDFPKHNAPHSMTSAISVQVPVMLINRFLSEAIAGLYHMAFRIVQAPVILITGSIGQVYSQTVSEMYRSGGDIHRFTRRLYVVLSMLSFFPFALLTVWGAEIFTFILGEQWTEAGRYAQIFAPAFFLVFIVSPTIYLTALLNKQKEAFRFELVFILLRLGGLSWGLYLGDPVVAVAGYSGATVLMMIFYLIWLLKITRQASALNKDERLM